MTFSTYDTNETGDRHNEDKVILSFLDDADKALEGCAKVLMFGAEKYSRGNWLKGLDWINGIYDSMRRHQVAFLNGEDLDADSKLPHVDHILCNALFLSQMYHTRKDLDDRVNKPAKYVGIDLAKPGSDRTVEEIINQFETKKPEKSLLTPYTHQTAVIDESVSDIDELVGALQNWLKYNEPVPKEVHTLIISGIYKHYGLSSFIYQGNFFKVKYVP